MGGHEPRTYGWIWRTLKRKRVCRGDVPGYKIIHLVEKLKSTSSGFTNPRPPVALATKQLFLLTLIHVRYIEPDLRKF
jgi:hypothetical protein